MFMFSALCYRSLFKRVTLIMGFGRSPYSNALNALPKSLPNICNIYSFLGFCQFLPAGSENFEAPDLGLDKIRPCQEELESFVQGHLSPLAQLLESHAERHLYQLPPRSEGLKLGKVLQAVEAHKSGHLDPRATFSS